MALETINPTNGVRVRAYTEASPAEVQSALVNAQAAFEARRRTSFAKRATHMRFAASLLRERKDELAQLDGRSRWASRWPRAGPRSRSAPGSASTTRTRPRASSRPETSRRPTPAGASSRSRPSASCSR